MMKQYLEFYNRRTISSGWWGNLTEATGTFRPEIHKTIYKDIDAFLNQLEYQLLDEPGYFFRYLSNARTYIIAKLEQPKEKVDGRVNMVCTIRVPIQEPQEAPIPIGESLKYCLEYLSDFAGEAVTIPETAREITDRLKLTQEWTSRFMECLYCRNTNRPLLLHLDQKDLQQAVDLLSLGYFLLPQVKRTDFSAAFNLRQEKANGYLFVVSTEITASACTGINGQFEFDCRRMYLKTMFSQLAALCQENGWNNKFTENFENKYIGNQMPEGIYLNSRIWLFREQISLPLCFSWKEYCEASRQISSAQDNVYAEGLRYAMLRDINTSGSSEGERKALLREELIALAEQHTVDPSDLEQITDDIKEEGIEDRECTALIDIVSANPQFAQRLTNLCLKKSILSSQALFEHAANNPEDFLDWFQKNLPFLSSNPEAGKEALDKALEYTVEEAQKNHADYCNKIFEICDNMEGGKGQEIAGICIRKCLTRIEERADIQSFRKFTETFSDYIGGRKTLFEDSLLSISERDMNRLDAAKIQEYHQLEKYFPNTINKIFKAFVAVIREQGCKQNGLMYCSEILKTLLNWVNDSGLQGRYSDEKSVLEKLDWESQKQKVQHQVAGSGIAHSALLLKEGDAHQVQNTLILQTLRDNLKAAAEIDPAECRELLAQLYKKTDILLFPSTKNAAADLEYQMMVLLPWGETELRLRILMLASSQNESALYEAFWSKFEIAEMNLLMESLRNMDTASEEENIISLLKEHKPEENSQAWQLFSHFYLLETRTDDKTAADVAGWLKHHCSKSVRKDFLHMLMDTVDVHGNRNQVHMHVTVLKSFIAKDDILDLAEDLYRYNQPEKYRAIYREVTGISLPNINIPELSAPDISIFKNLFHRKE